MILDTSAIMAILQEEPGHEALMTAVEGAPALSISAATRLELGIVSEGRGGPGARIAVETLLDGNAVEVAPFTATQAALALAAWRRFGKGRHPAALNLGDCFAYALAMDRGQPLLFKGEDFARTDVKAAI